MTLLLTDGDVRTACAMPELVSSLADGLRKGGEGSGALIPERLNLAVGPKFLRVMPAVLPEAGIYGLKFFQGSMADGVRYVVIVGSLDTGEILAMLDSAYLTAARTGATSAVATAALARPDAATVGVVGSGLEARTNLTAIAAVRPLSDVHVFSRDARRRAEFAAAMSTQLSVPVTACNSAVEAVRGRDVVIVATNTGTNGPVAYEGAWAEPGQHVVSIGSTSPVLREIDPATFLRADHVVFDAPAAQIGEESGDVVALLAERPGWNGGTALADLLGGRATGRRRPEDITVYKSVGTAEQDLVAALHVYESALRLGLGTEIGELAVPKKF